MKNLIEKLDSTVGHINPRYDAKYSDMQTIYHCFKSDVFKLISYSFRFGYMQGQKAEKAAQKARAAQ